MGLLESIKDLGRSARARKYAALILFASFMVVGFALVAQAGVAQVKSTQSQTIEGEILGLSRGHVQDLSWEGFGYAEVRALELQCGVSLRFLTEPEWSDYQATGRLPSPHLHCQRTSTVVPGSIAAVLVDNQLLNASSWRAEIVLVEVSYPYSILAIPAIVLLLLGAVGLVVLALQQVVLGWHDRGFREK